MEEASDIEQGTEEMREDIWLRHPSIKLIFYLQYISIYGIIGPVSPFRRRRPPFRGDATS